MKAFVSFFLCESVSPRVINWENKENNKINKSHNNRTNLSTILDNIAFSVCISTDFNPSQTFYYFHKKRIELKKYDADALFAE